ncbi:ribosomal maturation YjgA family protein [Flavobacterium hydrophilum]|uniref:DUF2809 domain-containing protein n=1 Tax=Flavobacterium hydrophilum TaxID=2211445 RepID=A0A2V4C5I1_9FLAO|nr:DUF2809 domain-containing protein [Flavobacterium hydrophilum]PXY45922.1 DUF2809 domain-containing protein [Flavobacterium hydrophilum]
MRIFVFLFSLKSDLKKYRLYYFLLFLGIIFLGIISRKIDFIPLCFGDFLYAVMIYILTRIFLIKHKSIRSAFISLLICYSIEFFQLYQEDWIIAVRKTLFGKYILGQGFLWTDIMAYTIGISFIFITEKIILKKSSYETRFRIKQ